MFDPYGKVTVLDGNGTPRTGNQSAYGNRVGVSGRTLDTETGLLYFRTRYHDASLGRFLNRNPWGYVQERLSLYDYLKQNPGIYLEPFSICMPQCIDEWMALTKASRSLLGGWKNHGGTHIGHAGWQHDRPREPKEGKDHLTETRGYCNAFKKAFENMADCYNTHIEEDSIPNFIMNSWIEQQPMFNDLKDRCAHIQTRAAFEPEPVPVPAKNTASGMVPGYIYDESGRIVGRMEGLPVTMPLPVGLPLPTGGSPTPVGVPMPVFQPVFVL